jgi:hypothetical protein
LAGADGFRWRLASAIHAHAKNGAKMKMKSELSDWNQLAGITKFNAGKVRSVYRSAKRFKEEPACSKPEKNRAQPANSTTITTPRLRSSGERFAMKR